MMGKIKIEKIGEKDRPSIRYRIFLDDIDISRFVKLGGISIQFTDGLPVVKLEMIGALELPDDIQALVEIYKQEVEA